MPDTQTPKAHPAIPLCGGDRLARFSIGHIAVTGSLIFAVGYADWFSGREISFSIFYLLPVAYVTWFIGAKAGLLTALACALVWFQIEATHSNYSQPWIPMWNAAVRMVFFGLGVGVIVFAKRKETRLLGEVAERTQRLAEEADRRDRLEHEMVDLIAQEQMRVAQDLHDGLGQYLSALTFQTRLLADDLMRERSPYAAQAERMMVLIRETNQITRQLDRALRIPEAGAGGLLAAIRAHAVEFQELTGVRCEVESDQSELHLDELQILMLFRIVQEAFSNAVKHANPRVIRASLAVVDHALRVRIIDDGRAVAKEAVENSGSGLRTMAIRAELIGARLHTMPMDAAGFVVECIVPLANEAPGRRDDHDAS